MTEDDARCLREDHYPTDHLLTELSADPRLHRTDVECPPSSQKPVRRYRWLEQFCAWAEGQWPPGRHGCSEVREVLRELRHQVAVQRRAGHCALCGRRG
jgi:hypothetical protein